MRAPLWNEVGGRELEELLEIQPKYADKCDWGEVTNEDWVDLLRERHEIVDLCKNEYWKSQMWKILDERDWTWLLEEQPQLAKYKPAK